MQVSVKVVCDTKQWKKMERNLLRYEGVFVQTGWWRNVYSNGVPVAQVAAWNEEGHMNGGMFAGTYTPPRPFMRQGFVPLAKKNLKKFYPFIHQIAMGTMSWKQMGKTMGETFTQLLQETILKWNRPANSPATVAMKGFNDPLIGISGRMYDTVKYKVTFSKGEK